MLKLRLSDCVPLLDQQYPELPRITQAPPCFFSFPATVQTRSRTGTSTSHQHDQRQLNSSLLSNFELASFLSCLDSLFLFDLFQINLRCPCQLQPRAPAGPALHAHALANLSSSLGSQPSSLTTTTRDPNSESSNNIVSRLASLSILKPVLGRSSFSPQIQKKKKSSDSPLSSTSTPNKEEENNITVHHTWRAPLQGMLSYSSRFRF